MPYLYSVHLRPLSSLVSIVTIFQHTIIVNIKESILVSEMGDHSVMVLQEDSVMAL